MFNQSKTYSLSQEKIIELQKKMLAPNGDCLTTLSSWLEEILTSDIRYKPKQSNTGFDRSKLPVKTTEKIKISDYSTIGDFLTNELNGNTISTYQSGYGLHAITYDYDFDFFSFFLNTWEQFISDECPEFGYDKDNDDEGMDDSLVHYLDSKNCGYTSLHDFFWNKKLEDFIKENYIWLDLEEDTF